jgi:hypothetical protein
LKKDGKKDEKRGKNQEKDADIVHIILILTYMMVEV